ncbi:MAG: tetratricopeptide repeat protein [Nitrospiria bacterium]
MLPDHLTPLFIFNFNIMVKRVFIITLLFSLLWFLSERLHALYPIQENRVLTKAPELSIARLLSREYFTLWEKYLNDHFLFRNSLIRSKSWVDYYVFSISPSPDVIIGKNNWLFLKEEMVDFRKEGCQERFHMKLLVQKLQDLEKVLEQSGKKFIFLVPPNKSTIYPEMVNLKYSKGQCDKSKYDLFLEALKEFPVKSFLRLDPLLKAEREIHDVFYKTDTHWNIYGANVAIQGILHELALTPIEGNLPFIEISSCINNGDLAKLMALNLNVKESCPAIHHRSRIQVDNLKPLQNGRPRVRTRVIQAADPLLPSALFFHDSFMDLPIEILEGTFSKVSTYWSAQPFIPQAAEDIINSKIIVIEAQERYLDWEWIDVRGIEFLLHPFKDKEVEKTFNTHVVQGSHFIEEKRWKEGIREIQEAVRLRPDYVSGYKYIAIAFQSAGSLNEAIDAYHKVVELDPYDPFAHYGLGVLFQRRGNNQEALSEFRSFIDLALPAYYQSYIEQAESFILTLQKKAVS